MPCIHRLLQVQKVSIQPGLQFLLFSWCIHMITVLGMIHQLNHSSLDPWGQCIYLVPMKYPGQMMEIQKVDYMSKDMAHTLGVLHDLHQSSHLHLSYTSSSNVISIFPIFFLIVYIVVVVNLKQL